MIDIRTDVADVKAGLEKLGSELHAVSKPIARYVGFALKRWITKRMGQHIRRGTEGKALTGRRGGALHQGDRGQGLFGSIYFKARAQGGVVTTALAYYGEALEKGWTIKPKEKGHLTFRNANNGWVRKKFVTLPALHWFTRSEAGFEDSVEFDRAVHAPLTAAIRKAGLQ